MAEPGARRHCIWSVPGRVTVEEKSNEITAIPELLA
jgi:hypothetical protein